MLPRPLSGPFFLPLFTTTTNTHIPFQKLTQPCSSMPLSSLPVTPCALTLSTSQGREITEKGQAALDACANAILNDEE